MHQRYYLRYANFYWLIAEFDHEIGFAFGYANLNDDLLAEWGYISINELLENGAELDRDWVPCTYEVAMKKIRAERNEGSPNGKEADDHSR